MGRDCRKASAALMAFHEAFITASRISDVGIFVKPRLESFLSEPTIRGAGTLDKSIYSCNQKVLQSLLRQIRLDANLSQTELAKRLGEPQSFVSKYESGERRLDIVELRSICKAMGVSLDAFVHRLEAALNEA